MSLPRYPAYKDSGVEWLGQVPAHWETCRISSLARPEPGSFVDGDWIESPYITSDGNGIRLLQTGNVGIGVFKEQGFRYITTETFYELRCTEVSPGDILICRLADPVGRACIAPDLGCKMITSVDVCILKSRTDVLPSFVVYVCSSAHYLGYMDGQCRGGTRDRVSRSFLGGVRVCIPSLPEQTAIAAFLDRETAKIDALMAEQQRLIDLLKEKRQAVISQAVTKGLNPGAPMKDSGVEWLGEIPAHWTLPPVYVRYDQALGKMLDHGKMTGEHPTPYLRNLDVRWDYINSDDLPVMDIAPHEKERFMVRKGDLLMVEGRELGRCAIWDGSDGEIAFQKALHRLRPMDSSEHTRFFFYMMAFANSTAMFLANQSPNEIPHLTGEELRRYRFPKPPIHEQVAIAIFLDAETARLDALTAEAQHAIDLLRERRSALISAAVTGQIDVRHLTPSEAA